MVADRSHQICKAGLMGNTRKIWLTRHGESMFNTMELLGGDSELSTRGQEYARHLPDVLMARVAKASEDVAAQVITPTLGTSYPDPSAIPISVWTSTLRRTIATARGLPFPKLAWKALDEIDAGICDGLSYADIAAQHPDEFAARKKDKLRYRYPRGESYLDCVQRIEPVITELERERESVVIVAHQAILRIIYGYLMAKPQEDIPNISIPLHTLIELTPMPDGTLSELRIPVPVAGDRPLRDHSSNGNNPLPLTSSMDVTTNAALAAATVAMAAAAVRGSSGSGAGAVPVEMHTGSALGEGAIGAAPAVEATPVVSASATC